MQPTAVVAAMVVDGCCCLCILLACFVCLSLFQGVQQQHGTFGLQHANDELDAGTATLWFAGKQLLPKNQLSHHLGRHEKTKAVIKLQQAGQGAPAREAVLLVLLLLMQASSNHTVLCNCSKGAFAASFLARSCAMTPQ